MRLLSTKDLTLHLFFDDAIPKYTILSHTWGKEEVTHQEMLNPTRAIQEKAGYEKIRRCAEISYDEGYEYTWIDTCCIDKTSSAELSESINSMFAWYRKAAYCLVYLEDFHGNHLKDLTGDIRWFQRGWTVQELIAPVLVVFYSASWGVIEEAHFFTKKLEKLTSIDQSVLRRSSSLDEISIAKKMSWFANRTTTRVEDMAYSMLGIMGINMPLIYGEGEVAFRRLQEEIIRNSDDASILLWKGTTEAAFDFRDPLARSPKEFSFANAPQAPDASFDEPFAMTNKGLALKADLISVAEAYSDFDAGFPDYMHLYEDVQRRSLFLLPIESAEKQNDDTSSLHFLVLRQVRSKPNQFVRVHPSLIISSRLWLGHGRTSAHRKETSLFISDRIPWHDPKVFLPCRGLLLSWWPDQISKEIISPHYTNPEPSESSRTLQAAYDISVPLRPYDFVLEYCVVLIYDAYQNTLRLCIFRGHADSIAFRDESGSVARLVSRCSGYDSFHYNETLRVSQKAEEFNFEDHEFSIRAQKVRAGDTVDLSISIDISSTRYQK